MGSDLPSYQRTRMAEWWGFVELFEGTVGLFEGAVGVYQGAAGHYQGAEVLGCCKKCYHHFYHAWG